MGNEPTIFLKDLDLIKKVEVTDHEHFFDYGMYPTLGLVDEFQK